MRKIPWAKVNVGEGEAEAVRKVVADGWISGSGPTVKRFERKFARKVGAKHGIAVCNGTCGLLAILLVLKEFYKKKPKIAVPTWTYLATITTADLIGKIEFIDANRHTFNILPNIPKDVDIIMPVDIGGMPVDYEKLGQYDKPIIADSAEALGSIYKGKKVGSIANAHLFSLHAVKIITSGEGGMITTNNNFLANDIRRVCNQGYASSIKREYIHSVKGFNFRMTEMQAAIGLFQLRERLDEGISRRREIVNIYKDIIGSKVDYQMEPSDRKSSYWLFTILVDPKIRDGLVNHLSKKNIGTRIWRPAHLQPPFANNRKFENAEYIYKRNIHLPIYDLLTDEDVKYVAEIIRRYLR